MNRREWLAGALASGALPTLSSADAAESVLLPCINQQTTLDAGFERECAAYAAAGFRRVELWFPKLRKLGLSPTTVVAVLRRAGLTPQSACSSDARLTHPKEDFEGHLPEFESNMELAQALAVPRYVITSSATKDLQPDDYKVAAARLNTVAEMASRYKVRIALEFIAGSKLIGCLPTALSLIRSAGHRNAGICLDTFHFFVGSSKTEDLPQLRAGEIEHVHFHDVPSSIPRERLRDTDRLPPGEGSLPLAIVTAALRRAGYRGALSVELFGEAFHTGDPKLVAERCYRAVRRYTGA